MNVSGTGLVTCAGNAGGVGLGIGWAGGGVGTLNVSNGAVVVTNYSPSVDGISINADLELSSVSQVMADASQQGANVVFPGGQWANAGKTHVPGNYAGVQALRDLRIWGPRQNLLQRHLNRIKPKQVEAALLHAARIDRISKGLAKGDVWDELLQLGLRFAQRPAKPARAA